MAEKHTERQSNRHVLKKRFTREIINRTLLSTHIFKKRQPFGLIGKRNGDIYVTKKTPYKAQLYKCEKLLNAGVSEIVIHGLGNAINRACHLALQLKDIHYSTIDVDVKTSTVNLIDDFEPITDDGEYEVNNRSNSCVHIRLFRKMPMETLRFAD